MLFVRFVANLFLMNVTHLECALCGLRHEAGVLQNLCIECGKPLLVRYYLEKAAQTMTKESLAWAVRKDDEPLRFAINQELAEIKNSGKLKEILSRWVTLRIW